MAQIRKVKNKKGIGYRAVVRYKSFYKSQTFNSKDEAKIWANELEIRLKKGKVQINAKNKDNIIVTVEDLIQDYKKNVAEKKYSHPEKYDVMYDWWIDKIGTVNLQDLKASTLSQCKKLLMNEAPSKNYKKHEKKSNSTVNKYLFALSSALNYAFKELEIIDSNPMSKVAKLSKNNGVVRFLSQEEIDKLLSLCKKHSNRLYIFVLIAVSTGARYSEIINLNVENIDFINNMFHFINTKNNENRGVPGVYKVLEEVNNFLFEQDIESGYIFLNDEKTKLSYLKGAFEKVVKEAKIENFRFHDLRHTCASYLAMNGASLLDIAEILGHKTLNMVKRYAHLTQKHTANLLTRMNDNILNL